MGWFEVDAKGLAALLERRGKGWAIAELVQNAWDADGVTKVDVQLTPIGGRPLPNDSPAARYAALLDLSKDPPRNYRIGWGATTPGKNREDGWVPGESGEGVMRR